MSSPNDPKDPTDKDTIDFDAMLEDLPGADGADGDDYEDDGWEHPEELVLLAAQRFPDAGEPGGDVATEEAIPALCKEIDPDGEELASYYEGAAVFDLGELVGPPGRLDGRAVCFVDISADDADEDDEEDFGEGLTVYLTVCNEDQAEVLASSFMQEVAPQISTSQDRMRLASLLLDGLSLWQPGAGGMCLHTIILDPSNPNRIFVAISAAGAFRSDDAGQTWRPLTTASSPNSNCPTRRRRSAIAFTTWQCIPPIRVCCLCRNTGM